MKVETGGYRGWAPLKFFEGKNPDGSARTSEGFRNVVNNHEIHPENGWNGEPPYATGDQACVRHSSPAYRRGYDQINWGT